MKKSILIGVLAALMLFAFTACEQQGYKIPIGLELTNAKTTYLVGEPFDYEAITGTVSFSDDSSKNVTGMDLIGSNVSTDGAGTRLATFAYGGTQSGVVASVAYEVATPVSVKLTTLPTTGEIGATTIKGVPAEVKLSNGETISMDVDVTVTALAGQAGSQAAVTVGSIKLYTTTVDAAKITGDENWKVTLTAASDKFDASNVTSLVVVYTNSDSNSSAESPYVGDTVTAAIYAVDGNGNRNTTALTPSDYVVKDGKTLTLSHTVTKDASEVYTVIYKAKPTVSVDVQFKGGRGYVSNLTATAKVPQPAIVEGSTMTPEMLATYYTIDTTYVGPEGGDIALNATNCVISNPTVTKTSYTPSVQVFYGKAGAEEWKALSLTALSVTDK